MDLFYFFSENQPLFWLLVTISLVLKGFALWRAAKKDHVTWFIALLVINTFGLLELAYLLYFSQKEFTRKLDRKILRK